MESDSTKFQSLRGMRDILPEDVCRYRQVEQAFWRASENHGFSEIRTPVLEPSELYTRTVGEGSDIVHREMYSFQDRSENHVSLRPEGTAGVARAFVQHGFANRPQPVKLCYVASMYRYERPQAGRYREHEQFGLEVFGASDASVDSEVILTAWQAYQSLGISDDVTVQINSIGGDESKQAIRQAVVDTVTPYRSRLSEDAQRQLDENPLRLLDNKDPQVRELTAGVPPAIDQLTAADRDHFTAVLEYLDEVGVPYELNPRLVRGLDYYTRTVWEFCHSATGDTALSAGGRYDKLIEQVGGKPTPAVGMGNGVDRIADVLKSQGSESKPEVNPEIFMVQLGEAAKKLSFGLIGELTAAGLGVTSASGKESIRAQLKHADKLGASMALIIGQKEAMDGSIIIRDMASGMQETVGISDALKEIKRRIPSAVKSNLSK